MLGVFKFIKNIFLLNQCLTQEEEFQKKEGYSIVATQEGPERHVVYYEGKKEAVIAVSYGWLNNVTLYPNSFRKWDKPRGQELTSYEFQKILKRLIQYFSCWGEVTLDHTLPNNDIGLKDSLIQDGIPFEELEDGIIHYSATVEEEKNRKDGFFTS